MPSARNSTFQVSHVLPTHAPTLSLPLAVRKALQALRRDACLSLRSTLRRRPRTATVMVVVAGFALIAFVAAVYLTHTKLGERLGCECVAPSSPRLVTAMLRTAAFVVRARASTLRKGEWPGGMDDAFVFRVGTLFNGPFGALRPPLVVRRSHVAVCNRRGRGDAGSSSLGGTGDVSQGDWLVVAGGVFPQGDLFNASLAIPAPPMSPTACGNRVWLAAWNNLPSSVRAALDDGANGLQLDPFPLSSISGRRGSDQRTTHFDWFLEGVSVVAGCKGRADTLRQALASWRAATGVDEIVLVDWASDPPLASVLPSDALADPRVNLIRVAHQPDWILTRAYNLAIRATTRTRVLKVDCDTVVRPDFLAVHPLERGIFYAGNWNSLDVGFSNALHANGVLYASSADVLAVGAYDERIVTYGWDDTDLVSRLAKRASARTIRYDCLRHLPHAAELRVGGQRGRVRTVLAPLEPLAAAVEIQRNRLLLTRYGLPNWSSRSSHLRWIVSVPDAYGGSSGGGGGAGGDGFSVNAMPLSNVPDAASLVSEGEGAEAAKRAIRIVLRRYGVQSLPKTLSLSYFKSLAAKVVAPHLYADVVFSLRGGCAARLLALSAALSASDDSRQDNGGGYVAPPAPYLGWRTRFVWRPDRAECLCAFSAVFAPLDAEIVPAWADIANPVPVVSLRAASSQGDVREVLAAFDARAVRTNVSAAVRRWLPSPPPPLGNTSDAGSDNTHPWRTLITHVACSTGAPRNVSEAVAASARARSFLRSVAPHDDVVVGVVRSLNAAAAPLRLRLDEAALAPHALRAALGPERAATLHVAFDEPAVARVAAVWGGASAVVTARSAAPLRLLQRARALAAAAAVARKQLDGPLPGIASDVRAMALTIASCLDAFFKGCVSHPSEYLDELPELAIILAALLSSNVCQ